MTKKLKNIEELGNLELKKVIGGRDFVRCVGGAYGSALKNGAAAAVGGWKAGGAWGALIAGGGTAIGSEIVYMAGSKYC